MSITLTEKAANYVKEHLARRGKGIGLRVGVKSSGCSGLSYVLEYADEIHSEDIVFESHGVTVVTDPKGLLHLDGSELDLVREGLNVGLKFNNPNVKDSCGCGKSFTV
ncbi:MAG: iron-sulfur cluster assembly protein IscA [Gammaproteobacteria bacterium]|nr:iron-sulfur cluster assembly protein IscA [Gammaproteobacteria bacterium]